MEQKNKKITWIFDTSIFALQILRTDRKVQWMESKHLADKKGDPKNKFVFVDSEEYICFTYIYSMDCPTGDPSRFNNILWSH